MAAPEDAALLMVEDCFLLSMAMYFLTRRVRDDLLQGFVVDNLEEEETHWLDILHNRLMNGNLLYCLIKLR